LIMSKVTAIKCRDRSSYSAYLLHVLQKRRVELTDAYRHIAQLHWQVCEVKNDAGIQTQTEIDDVTLHGYTSHCDKCSTLEKTVKDLKQELSDSTQSVISRNAELSELKRRNADLAVLISELRAQADVEEAARKAKQEQIEELEELVIVCRSESVAAEQKQCGVVESMALENESLKLELNSLKDSLQTKEEALAQNMFEKDELEDMNAHFQATNSSLQHQMDELQLQLQNQKSDFEGEIKNLADEKHQLMEKVLNLSAELSKCQQSVSVSFACSQNTDFLVSQQPSELSSVKLELLTVQVEKEDLIQQLQHCKSELSSLRVNSGPANHSPSVRDDSKPRFANMSYSAKPPNTASSLELENQNAALLGQLLILEDQLSESDARLQECRENCRQSAQRLTTALKERSDFSARVTRLEKEKLDLETELGASKVNLENIEVRLQESETNLSLIEGKLSSAGNRQRQLLCQKQLLESQNRELSQKLQLAMPGSTQQLNSVSSHGTNSGEHANPCMKIRTNQASAAYNVGAKILQQSGDRKIVTTNVADVDDDSKFQGTVLVVGSESHVPQWKTVSAMVDRRLVPCTTSPAAVLTATALPTSVCSASFVSANAGVSLKRHMVATTTNSSSGGKRHLFGNNDHRLGEYE